MEKEILLFGGLLLDHYFSVDRWPQRGQDGYVVGQARFVGGCAANMAVTIHNLGGHPHVVSCVGSDRSLIAGATFIPSHPEGHHHAVSKPPCHAR